MVFMLTDLPSEFVPGTPPTIAEMVFRDKDDGLGFSKRIVDLGTAGTTLPLISLAEWGIVRRALGDIS
ncbi:MAG: hypothetical protein GTO13_16065 [Proteobacteria bacterium]|nr:hypothetical protein [Pseudomonadota bacterium]